MIAAMALAATVACLADTDPCRISTVRPARSFIAGEPIRFTVQSDLPLQNVTWTVTDHRGAMRASGSARFGGGGASTLRVSPAVGVGYYTLALQFEQGGETTRPFCVLPDPEEGRGAYSGIFGIGGANTSPVVWDFAAQAGARQMRAEFGWTSVERYEGQYELPWVETVADLAEARGMQLTVLTGHTPAHYAARPADLDRGIAGPSYTWQPEGTVEWYRFIDAMAGRLASRQLPAESAEPSDTLPRAGKRLVVAWEVWSEADAAFYFGSWDRYLDMLRIAWCTVRSHGRVPVVYGSCGHMTEMNLTCDAGVGDYFDRIAYHPHGARPEYDLMHWYRNMPQALIARGIPRDSAFTECDFHGSSAESEPGFILRLYATLRAMDERHFVRSSCTGGVISGRDVAYGMARAVGDGLEPRPAYVGFALTRWLLESAHYIGPLPAPEGAHVELFMRDGVPLAVAWTEAEPEQVSLQVAPSAFLLDALGGSTRIGDRPTAALDLTPEAVAVVNVSMESVPDAISGAIERALTTELGHESPHDSGWIDTLEADAAAVVAPDFAQRLRAAVADANQQVRRNPSQGAGAFFAVQRAIGDGMLRAAMNARAEGELRPLHTNTIWRLAKLSEQVGAMADGLGERWRRMNNVSRNDLAKTLNQAQSIRSRVAEKHGGAECPFANRLIERALDQLDHVRQSGGHSRGAWWAATLHVRVAHALTGVERPKLLRVFTVGEFETADIITKGMLAQPGPGHVVNARVYNFLDRDVAGHLQLTGPQTWPMSRPVAGFIAPAGEPSQPVPLGYAAPDQPRPWVQRELARPRPYNIPVDAPAAIPLAERLWLCATTGGLSLEPMGYNVMIGAYPAEAAPEAATPMGIGLVHQPITPPPAQPKMTLGLPEVLRATRYGASR
jgi:hypothetical protein